jgi:hypothetical protein
MKVPSKALVGGALLLLLFSAVGKADGRQGGNNTVVWETIIGVIQAGNVVAGIPGGGEPWSTLGGHAFADLTNGVVAFDVRGLALAGGNTIGTTGGVPTVEGTLVCNPAAATPTIINTAAVTLDAQGNASFYGSVGSTAACSPTSVAFLIRITSNGHWVANGSVIAP